MEQPQRRGLAVAAQLAAAAALVAWRVAAHSWHPVWKDIVFLLCLYWVFCLFFLRTRAWGPVTALLVSTLAVIYLNGQMPHMLLVYNLLP